MGTSITQVNTCIDSLEPLDSIRRTNIIYYKLLPKDHLYLIVSSRYGVGHHWCSVVIAQSGGHFTSISSYVLCFHMKLIITCTGVIWMFVVNEPESVHGSMIRFILTRKHQGYQT